MQTWQLDPKLGLTLQPVEAPPLGPTDVRVRMRAASLNYRDLLIAKGAASRSAPVIPASDGAGEVIAVGEQVSRFRVGDRVMANFFPAWVDGELSEAGHQSALGGNAPGVLREELVLDEKSWVSMPKGWSFEEAATLPCAGLTAWQALFEVTRLKPGQKVLLLGSGGVSVFGLQLAKAAGAHVTITTSQDAKADRLRALGADEVVNYKSTPNWGKHIREATGGVDLALEVGGAGTFEQSIEALRFGGELSLIGVLAGIRAELSLYGLMHKRLTVHGIYVGSVAMFERFVQALDATKLRPIIDKTYSFADLKDAYAHLESGEHLGKVVVQI